MNIHEAIKTIRRQGSGLSTQQLRTLKGQVLAGDIDGAMKGLERLKEQGKGKQIWQKDTT